MENPQTQNYKQILFDILTLKTIIGFVQNKAENVSAQAKVCGKAYKANQTKICSLYFFRNCTMLAEVQRRLKSSTIAGRSCRTT